MINPRDYRRVVTTNQPTIFPPIYIVHRMSIARYMILVGMAQYNRDHTQSHIVNHNGLLKMSFPVKDKRMKPFNKLYPANLQKWKKNLSRTIEVTYGRTVGYKDGTLDKFNEMMGVIEQGHTVADIGAILADWLCDILGYDCEVLSDDQLLPKNELKASEWMAALAKEVDADLYFQGRNSMNSYFNKSNFDGITLAYQNAKFKPYKHVDGNKYDLSKISIVDPLFVLGVDGTKNLIAQAGKGLEKWE